MVGLVERFVIGVVLGRWCLGVLGCRWFGKVKVVDMEICPYRPMVTAESPKMLIGGAIGDRCEISKS